MKQFGHLGLHSQPAGGAHLWRWCLLFVMLALASVAMGHDVSSRDAELIAGKTGPQPWIYAWLGAKHMVTGYDHLLFLVGVIFYLRNIREVVVYVSLFAAGHSITLIGGVLAGLEVNPYVVDAIIGLSVAYKGFDNLNGFDKLFGERPNEKLAVLVFGLFHGLGLGTKLQDLGLARDGLLENLVSFNVGVELGQLAALVVILLALRLLPKSAERPMVGTVVNIGLIIAGFVLVAYQIVQSLQST